MKAASQVPSGVLTSTSFSTSSNLAADTEPVVAASPTAADNATKSRRDRSSGEAPLRSRAFLSCVILLLLSRSSARLLTAYYGSDPAWKWQLIGSSNTDESVTLSKPRHIDITADRAYVVVPATYSYKEKGRWLRSPARYGRWL